MTTFTEARYGLTWNYATGDTGWGPSFNLGVRTLGALMNCFLLSDTVGTPPTSPAEGDAYFVPVAGGTGAWVASAGKIAAYQGGAWRFYTPANGLRAYIASRSSFYWFNATSWVAEVTSGSGVTSVATRTGDVVLSVADINGAAPLASPALTGTPTTPNVATGDASSTISNTQHVADKFAAFADNVFGSGTEGDIIIRGATTWTRLGYGVSGHVLTTHGVGALPSWDAATGGSIGPVVTTVYTLHAPDGTDTTNNAAAPTQLLLEGGNAATVGGGVSSNGGNVLIEAGTGTWVSGVVYVRGGAGQGYTDPTTDGYTPAQLTLQGINATTSVGYALLQGATYTVNSSRTGGNVFVAGGDVQQGNGGNVTIRGGTTADVSTGGEGGGVSITTNSGGRSGRSGITVRVSDNGGSGGSPDDLILGGGNNASNSGLAWNGHGGDVKINGGTSVGDGNRGGDITIAPGTATNGSISAGRRGLVIIPNLPTADPHVVNALWNDAGVLTVSAG